VRLKIIKRASFFVSCVSSKNKNLFKLNWKLTNYGQIFIHFFFGVFFISSASFHFLSVLQHKIADWNGSINSIYFVLDFVSFCIFYYHRKYSISSKHHHHQHSIIFNSLIFIIKIKTHSILFLYHYLITLDNDCISDYFLKVVFFYHEIKVLFILSSFSSFRKL
jgi:hypothetical protein